MALLGIPETLWPIHLRPESNELLSSWMVRFAHAHGLRAESLCTVLFGWASPVWNRDIDRSVPDAMLTKLSLASANDLNVLRQCTLVSFEGVISEQVNYKGSSLGILPLGIYHRKRRRPSLMYCPQCLRADANPYYRKAWRISWVTICLTHGLQLLDQCPQCGEPITPHRVDIHWRRQTTVSSRLHACCSICCFDLGLADAPLATVDEISAATWIAKALQDGWVWIGDSVVYSPAFFMGINALVLALHKGSEWQGFDMAPLSMRRDLISRACALLQDWPKQFLEVAEQNNWTAVNVTSSRKQLPFWLHQVVKLNIDQGRAPMSTVEADAILQHTYATTGEYSFEKARVISGRGIERRHVSSIYASQVSDDSFALLLAHIDHLISQQRDPVERCHLFADKVMLVLARIYALEQTQLAKLSLDQAVALASNRRADFWHMPTKRNDAAAWLGWYLRSVRPELEPPPETTSAFVCRGTRRPLSASAIGERFRKHCRDAVLQREIKSFSFLTRRYQDTRV